MKKGNAKIDLAEIDKLFDQSEAEENRSTLSIIFASANNLIMMGVIAFSGVVLMKMNDKK